MKKHLLLSVLAVAAMFSATATTLTFNTTDKDRYNKITTTYDEATGVWTLVADEGTGNIDAYNFTNPIGAVLPAEETELRFEYKSTTGVPNNEIFFFFVKTATQFLNINNPFNLPATDNWTLIKYDLTNAISQGFGDQAADMFRLDINNAGTQIQIRNLEICSPSKPTAVDAINVNKQATVVARYNLLGQKLNRPEAGVNIVKLSDGTTQKVLVK